MATGETTTVTRTVPTEVEVVALTLDRDEAQFLRDLLGWVGGDSETSRRGLCDNILEALREAGVCYRHVNDFDFTGGVYMQPTS